MILNRAEDYYQNNKELLRERAKNKYGELSEEKDTVICQKIKKNKN